MQIIENPPINFLYYREETTVDQLEKFLPYGQRLFQEAVSKGVPVTGPVHWHYYNFDGPSSSFLLEISIPIGEFPKDYDGAFHIKRTDAFRSVSELHLGSWHELPKTYEKIMSFIADQKLKRVGQNREIYINVDLVNNSANQTLVQLGIIR